MPQEPINAESSLEEQLVAYLDGELDAESCRRIEEQLAVDPEVRRKLNWLEQTWEMLDELDTAPVNENFTRSTLEMVTVAAQEDVRKDLEQAPRRRRRLWLFSGVVLLAAGLTGFMAVALTTPNPNQQLLEDLPVLENLDEYRQINDIQFLRMLREKGLFAEKDDNTSSRSTAARAGEDYIKTLNPDEQYELQRKQERFNNLEPAEQDQLRSLHKQIQADEHREELLGVMKRYYEWCKLLPEYSRFKLASLSPEERIGWIENRKEEELTTISSKPPTIKDADRLWSWMRDYAAKREQQFRDGLPQRMQKNFTGMSTSARSWAVMWMMWQRQPGGPNRPLQITDDDLKDLRSKLTPQTRTLLDSKTTAEQKRIVQTWAHNLLRQKRGPDVGELVDDKLLAEFFEKELTDEERDELMNLSGEDMRGKLLQLYIAKKKPPEMFPHRPDDMPPGPPPGAGFDPARRPPDRPGKP